MSIMTEIEGIFKKYGYDFNAEIETSDEQTSTSAEETVVETSVETEAVESTAEISISEESPDQESEKIITVGEDGEYKYV